MSESTTITDVIDLRLSDKEQQQIYKDELDAKRYNKIVIGKPGIKNIRNFMANYFKEKQKIFYIDDDISHIYQLFIIYNKQKKLQLILIKFI